MIVLANIKKSFDGRSVLSGFSYTFQESGLYVIYGESGAGKTTLLRIIAGLDKDFSGTAELACPVSYVFQEHRLFNSLNALENVVFAAFGEKNEETLLKSERMLLSLGFSKNELTLKPSELSGGMKQRVSIARALLYNAPVLLLDEPTKELDFDLSETVYSMIEKEAERRTVILVSHDERARTLTNASLIEIQNLHK